MQILTMTTANIILIPCGYSGKMSSANEHSAHSYVLIYYLLHIRMSKLGSEERVVSAHADAQLYRRSLLGAADQPQAPEHLPDLCIFPIFILALNVKVKIMLSISQF